MAKRTGTKVWMSMLLALIITAAAVMGTAHTVYAVEAKASTILKIDEEEGYYYFAESETNLEGKNLTVEGDLHISSGSSVKLGGATLHVTGDLHVMGRLYIEKGTVKVDGDMIQPSGNVHVGKGELSIIGDYHIASPYTNDANELDWEEGYGSLTMQYAEDVVNVDGDFYIWSEQGTLCSDGIMTVSGDFTAKKKSFSAWGSHKVILNGTDKQRVSFARNVSVHGQPYGFDALEIQNSKGIILNGYLFSTELTAINDELKIQAEGGFFERLTIQIPAVIVEGDLGICDDVKLQGNTLKINGDVTIDGGGVSLEKGRMVVSGDMTLAYGTLDVGKGTLDVTEDFYIAAPYINDASELDLEMGGGKLIMRYAEDAVYIGGDCYIWSWSEHACKAGTMTVAGDFIIMDSYFHASESHKVILNGTSAQKVGFVNGGSFATLEIQNREGIILSGINIASMTLPSVLSAVELIAAQDELKIQSEGGIFGFPDGLTIQIPTVTVQGDLSIRGEVKLQGNTLRVNGNVTIDMYNSDHVVGLEKGHLEVNGDLILADGLLDVGKGVLDISGDFYIANPSINGANELHWQTCDAQLIMRHAEDTVNVGGDFCSKGDGACSAGVLTVNGDFRVEGGFYVEGTHETRLYGPEPQTVTFAAWEYFYILRIDKNIDQYTFNPMPCWSILYGYVCDVHSGEWTVQTEATCTEEGLQTRICTICSTEEEKVIPAKGHTEVVDKAIVATCTATGKTEGKHCTVCGVVTVKQETVPVKDHAWDEGEVTKAPTEQTEGVRSYTCTACGDTKTEAVPVLGHTHEYVSVITAPTCTEQGYTKYTCSCGDSYITDIKNPIGHTFTQWIVTQEPDGDKPGIKTRVCFCGYKENEQLLNPFQDVANGKYFSKPVMWAYENGITTGKTATTFELDADCTRKQIVTFLWRAAGKPEPQNMEIPFVDVKQDQFTKAILWAAEQGITSGTGDGTTFSPEQTCTRKQIVMFLWRFNGKPAPQSTKNPFTDVKQDQFTNAILWAFEQGITTGKTATTFEPESTCTRGQIVTFLYRDMVE